MRMVIYFLGKRSNAFEKQIKRGKMEISTLSNINEIKTANWYTYFLVSDRSVLNFLDFTTCSIAGATASVPDNDLTHSGSIED